MVGGPNSFLLQCYIPIFFKSQLPMILWIIVNLYYVYSIDYFKIYHKRALNIVTNRLGAIHLCLLIKSIRILRANYGKEKILKAYYYKKVGLVDLSTHGGKIKFEFCRPEHHSSDKGFSGLFKLMPYGF